MIRNKAVLRSATLALTFAAGLATAGLVQSALADQPNMQRALEALRTARAFLQQAEPNKGGHRERAIDFVDRAIGETEAGIQFAR